jgi:hypothetical protein
MGSEFSMSPSRSDKEPSNADNESKEIEQSIIKIGLSPLDLLTAHKFIITNAEITFHRPTQKQKQKSFFLKKLLRLKHTRPID